MKNEIVAETPKLWRVKFYEIVSYPLVKELPSCYRVIVNKTEKNIMKDHFKKSRDSSLHTSHEEAVNALKGKLLSRIDFSQRTLNRTLQDVNDCGLDMVMRVRYLDTEIWQFESWEIIKRNPKTWEVDSKYNKQLPKGRVRGQFFQPKTNICPVDADRPFATFIFDDRSKHTVIDISKFGNDRIEYLRSLVENLSTGDSDVSSN